MVSHERAYSAAGLTSVPMTHVRFTYPSEGSSCQVVKGMDELHTQVTNASHLYWRVHLDHHYYLLVQAHPSFSTSFAFLRLPPSQHNDTHQPVQPVLSHSGMLNQRNNCSTSDLWCLRLVFQETKACMSIRFHYLHVFEQTFFR